MRYILEVDIPKGARKELMEWFLHQAICGLANYNDEVLFDSGIHHIRDIDAKPIGQWKIVKDMKDMKEGE